MVILPAGDRWRPHDSRREQAGDDGVCWWRRERWSRSGALVLSITVALLPLREERRRRHRPIQPSANGAEASGGRTLGIGSRSGFIPSNGQASFLP